MERARRRAIEDKLNEAQRAATISDAFGRYVSVDLAEELLRNPEALKPGGELRTVTVLMSDLRGFTSLTERLGPEGMVTLLNQYLKSMTDVIEDHDGYINEFIGDAILVIFGVPSPREDDPRRAVRCAIGMQRALDRFNAETHRDVPLQMGIGIHTGRVVIGNIGSEKRISYGVIGDAVNLTARIESLTVGSQILVSAVTQGLTGEGVEFDAPREVRVKGPVEPVVVYPVVGDENGPLVVDTAVRRTVRWAAKVSAIVDKVVSDESIHLAVEGVHGSRWSCVGPSTLELAMDVVFSVQAQGDGPWQGPLYAKVTAMDEGESGRMETELTITHCEIDLQQLGEGEGEGR